MFEVVYHRCNLPSEHDESGVCDANYDTLDEQTDAESK